LASLRSASRISSRAFSALGLDVDKAHKCCDSPAVQLGVRKLGEEKKNKTKLPALELQGRQSALDLMLSPDNTHVFVIISERRTGAKTAMVPNYVTETGYKTTCG
jgi:hypothetical protein